MSSKYSPRSDDPWYNEKREEKTPWQGKISLSSLAEPAIIVAVITAIFYIIISGYYDSYFQRLSIPFYVLDLPLTFYLYSAHWMLYVIYYIISLFICIDTLRIGRQVFKNAKTPRHDIIVVYIFLIYITIFTLFLIMDLVKNMLLIAFSAFAGLLWFYTIYKKIYMKGRIDKNSALVLIIFILVFTTSAPPFFGKVSAENLIRGEAGSFEVNLDMRNNNSDMINQTLILVIHSNNKYYLVKKNVSAPKDVKLYIIPDAEIKEATIRAVQKESRPFYEFYKDWRFF